MADRYFALAYSQVKGGCSVKFFSNQEFSWDLSIGGRLTDVWPKDMSVRMRADRPKNVTLVDYISNLESVLLASPRLQAFFRAQDLPDLEFLKVAILDHKGRVAASDYSVINCCRVIDCVDQKKSKFKWDGLENPSMQMKQMVLDGKALGPADKMIRPTFVPGLTLFREDLVDAINEQEFSGMGFTREVFGDFEVY